MVRRPPLAVSPRRLRPRPHRAQRPPLVRPAGPVVELRLHGGPSPSAVGLQRPSSSSSSSSPRSATPTVPGSFSAHLFPVETSTILLSLVSSVRYMKQNTMRIASSVCSET
ncbi:hypothetical protein EJB05_51124 [Eragrostis curvula]|uniref:Uncharacterized protein n=1 Tax=Eragrostis curvula TaxID=38414 RepID=A0A5J9SWJ3_9POAL|nr:hypothetical protein EJB05_51124 [Eragrostis curvula]